MKKYPQITVIGSSYAVIVAESIVFGNCVNSKQRQS